MAAEVALLETVPDPTPGAPEWIEPSFPFKAGADPLGFQTITTDRVIVRLLPGILALSQRARYFSFYAFLLGRYAAEKRTPTNAALSRYILAREYEFGIAVRLCPRKCGSSPIGARRVGAAINLAPTEFARGESVESTGGGYGLYYTSPMRMLGLVAGAGTMLGDAPIAIDILRPEVERAQRLATTFGAAVADTRYITEGWMDRTDPIPSEILAEYGSKACLCRLDEFDEERSVLRSVLFGEHADLDKRDVGARREAVALFLDRLATDSRTGTWDGALRRVVWDAFRSGASDGSPRARTQSRWAAVAASHWAQEGLALLWIAAGPALRNADRGDGLSQEEITTTLATLTEAEVEIAEGRVPLSPNLGTEEAIAAVAKAAGDVPLGELMWQLRSQRSVAAGLAAIFLVYANRPDAETVDKGWLEYGTIDGEWQPSLLRLFRYLEAHLEGQPTLAATASWLFDHFVVRVHQRIGYSKLPEFTFRFRWEIDRLRFYAHPFDWTEPGNIRAGTLNSLTEDLGYWVREDSTPKVTPDGIALVHEVFEE